MPHDRFFIDSLISGGSELNLEGEEAHHLQRVMRKKDGDLVELVNGKGVLASARISGSGKKGVRLEVVGIEIKEKRNFKTIICQALPRINRLDFIVEKGTELGMDELWLFPGQLSEKKELSQAQMTRLNTISISSMKQCGRYYLPQIEIRPPLSQWPSPLHYPAFYGEAESYAPPFLTAFVKKEGVLFFVGPEAGFSSEEKRILNHLQAVPVSLHFNVLRTDTASLAALSLISGIV